MNWWRLRQLESGDSRKRQRAARELGRSRDRRAVEPLLALMNSHDLPGDVAAAALGSIGDPSAVEPLGEYLHRQLDLDAPVVASAVMSALRDLGDRRAIPALLMALRSQNARIREPAADVLAHLGWAPTNDAETALVAVAKGQWDHCRGLGEAAVAPLAHLLYDERGRVVQEVASALAKIGGPAATDVLLTTFFKEARPGSGAHLEVMRSLVSLGPDVAGPFASRLREEMLKVEAALSGMAWDSPDVQGYETHVREAAAHLCAEIGGPAMPALLELARDPDRRVRLAAVEAIAFIPDPRALPALELALADPSNAVSVLAVKALQRRGWEPAGDETRRLRDTAVKRSQEYEYKGLGRRLEGERP